MSVRYSTDFLRKFLRFSYGADKNRAYESKTLYILFVIMKKIKKYIFIQPSTGTLCYNKKT